MGACKLLALDMDGTLLKSDKTISAATSAALRRAAECGVICALSTGRAISELADYEADFADTVRYAVLLSGAQVADLTTGECLSVRPIGADLTRTVSERGLFVNAMVQLFTSSAAVMTFADVERMPELGQGIYQSLARERGTLVDDLAAFVAEHAAEILKVNVHHVDEETLAGTQAALERLPLTLAGGESLTVEVTAAGVTKGTGLLGLCGHLGISASEMICVGDSENDLEALKVAGLAVAMGNACDEVREVADVIVADNDHDGVVEVIERWVL